MGIVMTKTARSAIFSQAHDFSCFVSDGGGRVLSQADGIPIHTGSGGFAIRGVLDFWGGDIAAGDVFLLNDPYVAGGNHLPDWTLIHPVFFEGDRVGFTANRAHQADIGGGAIGTYNPKATEIFHEGVRLPALKLIERGQPRRDLKELLRINCRLPEVMESDLDAMLGSARVGARRMLELFEKYGRKQAEGYFTALLDFSEQAMRRQIEAIPDGSYTGSDSMNNDCFSEREVKIQVTVTVAGSEIAVDFAGTDAQIAGFKNSALTNTHAAVYLALSTLVDPLTPHNEGTYRPIKVTAPLGSVVNAVSPAPVTYSTVFPAHEIIHAIW
ncbi:MAG: hydantoinase B/oxoprolinase family protein, partial [Chloroflexota bacterium]